MQIEKSLINDHLRVLLVPQNVKIASNWTFQKEDESIKFKTMDLYLVHSLGASYQIC